MRDGNAEVKCGALLLGHGLGGHQRHTPATRLRVDNACTIYNYAMSFHDAGKRSTVNCLVAAMMMMMMLKPTPREE